MIAAECYIMFAYNKTYDWLCNKPPEERDSIIKKARSCGPKLVEQYKARKLVIVQKQREAHEEKVR